MASPGEILDNLSDDSDKTVHMVLTYMPPDSIAAFQREYAEAVAKDPAALEQMLTQWRRAAQGYLNFSRG